MSTSETQVPKPTKLCFVTVGATAPFLGLLVSIFSPDFMEALSQAGYTHLLIQYGQDGQMYYGNFLTLYPPGSPGLHGIEIDGFDFNPAGLKQEMRMAQLNEREGRRGGLIISHAGSGTILEAMRLGVPLVVVPNPTLKNNHQMELADELQKQGYVLACNYTQVSKAVAKAEALRSRPSARPPIQGPNKRRTRTLEEVLSDEMGFLD